MTRDSFFAMVCFRVVLMGLCFGLISLGGLGTGIFMRWDTGVVIFYSISISLVTSMLAVLVIIQWFDLINPYWREDDYFESPGEKKITSHGEITSRGETTQWGAV